MKRGVARRRRTFFFGGGWRRADHSRVFRESGEIAPFISPLPLSLQYLPLARSSPRGPSPVHPFTSSPSPSPDSPPPQLHSDTRATDSRQRGGSPVFQPARQLVSPSPPPLTLLTLSPLTQARERHSQQTTHRLSPRSGREEKRAARWLGRSSLETSPWKTKESPKAPCVIHKKEQNKRAFSVHVDTPNSGDFRICGAGADR